MTKIVKQAKADIYLRDTDSQSLFNNSGVLSFKYYHEWNDCYNPVTDKTAQIDGETYDETTGAYKPNCPEGYSPVFNGRLSALWDNMVSCFPEKIQSMYKTMRDNGLSYKDMMAKYKEFWRYWCENLYNADAFGYANTNNFTKAYGDKLMMMDFFFQKRQRYLDSKYCCGSSASNNLRLRLYETGKGLAIKYYQAIYSSLQWGANNFSTKRNIEPGTYSYMPFGFSNPQDATFDIDDADLITELSTYTKTSSGYTITGLEGLGDFKFDLNMSLLKRLTKFIMSYTVAKPNTKELGDNFDLSGMKMLKQVIVRNVKNLTKSIVINSDMVEEIDFTNTPIVGITTPPSDSLTKLVLPNTITSLKLKGYTNLQSSGLQIAGYSNINEFEIEDCPNIDSYELLKACYDAGAPLTEVILKNVDWTLDDLSMLLYLAQKKAKLAGKITVSEGVKLSLAQKLQLMSAWGDIDDASNSLHITYSIVNITSVSVSGKSHVYEKGEYAFKATTFPLTGNNVKEFYWSISENDFATISSDGVLTLNKIGSKENDDKAMITLSVVLSDGSTKEASKEIKFYKKDCELGDYVFSDGTWGSTLYDNENCTPVGVVFYLEPVKRRFALATALKDDVSVMWGLYNQESSSDDNLSGITLGDDPNYDVYDVPWLDNYTQGYTVSDSVMLDSAAANNDGFKVYPKDTTIGDIGFEKITDTMYNQQGLGVYMSKAGLNVGDFISAGQLKTLRILKHRDKILSDSNINKPIPKATSSMTERENLEQCLNAIVSEHDNKQKYKQYYYPATSYAYSYEPKVRANEELADHLKANHWFLASMGEWSRLSFYQKHGVSGADEYSIFTNAYKDSKFTTFKDSMYWSSAEYDDFLAHCIGPVSGTYGGSYAFNGGKYKSNNVRPIVAFRI